MNRIVTLSLIAAAIGALCLGAYWPVLSADFVNFDDSVYVYANMDVRRGLSLDGLVWAFSKVHSSNWHPLTWLTHMADVSAFGLDARGHHATNLSIHILNSLLVFLLLVRLTQRTWSSLAVAMLFAVHPLNVESVAWISERKNVLSTLFGLLAIWAYAGYVERSGRGRAGCYALSLACFAASLMSKQMLVTMPFVLLLLDYWPLNRTEFGTRTDQTVGLRRLASGWARLLPEKIPYFALTIAASIVTLLAQRDAMAPLVSLRFSTRLANALVSYLTYLRVAAWPADLAIFYPHPSSSTPPWLVAVSAVAIVIISLLVFWGGRTRRYLLVGWFWYLGTLIPVIGLVQVGGQARADRYMYVPLIGIFIMVVWGAVDLVALRLNRRYATATALAVLLPLVGMLAWATHRQAETWRDTVSLFSHAIEATERNFLAHGNLAAIYFEQEQYETAVEHCQRAIEYNPRDFDARLILGMSLVGMNSTDRAFAIFGEAMQLRPENPVPLGQRGVILAEAGRVDLARPYLEKAVALADNLPKYGPLERKLFHRNWANVLARSKRFREAMDRYTIALELDPQYVDAWRESAEVALELGDPDEAVSRLEAALAIDQEDAQALVLLGTILAQQGKFDEAHERLAHAAEIEPGLPDTRIKLGKVLRALGRPSEAMPNFDSAITLLFEQRRSDGRHANVDGSIAEAYVQLAQIEVERGNRAEGLAQYNRALQYDRSNIEANNDLAWLLATRPEATSSDALRAVQLASRACTRTNYDQPAMLGTLAAAYAANGNFSKATEVADQALQIARADAAHNWIVSQLEEQLAAHRGGRRWVEPQR